MNNKRFKFRAWSVREQCWCGAFSIHKSGLFSEMINASLINGKCIADAHWQELNDQENIVLMQFTGLIDIKGCEIWEGDVVKITTEDGLTIEGVVTWDADAADYNIMAGLDFERAFGIDGDKYEVVGCIFSTKNLDEQPDNQSKQ